MGQTRARRYHPIEPNPPGLTLADLPAPDTRRWYLARKMLVVKAVRIGLLSFDQASERYSLSLEEFIGWQKLAVPNGERSTNTTLRKALRAEPLWIGSDRDDSKVPHEAETPVSFQPDLF